MRNTSVVMFRRVVAGQMPITHCVVRGLVEMFESKETAPRAIPLNFSLRGHTSSLDTSKCVISRQLTGISFKVSDDKAVDALFAYHGGAVHIHGVRRVMVPFWVSKSSAGGTMSGDVYTNDPTKALVRRKVWLSLPKMDFQYPLEEHLLFNQQAATYEYPLDSLNQCLRGSHVPSMLQSRFELLEELQSLKQTPTILPFSMSTDTAAKLLDKRIDHSLIHHYGKKEMEKHYGSHPYMRLQIDSMGAFLNQVRPTLLPMYVFTLTSATISVPTHSFVCGATGRVEGPKFALSRRDEWSTSAASAVAMGLSVIPFVDPPLVVCAGLLGAALGRLGLKEFRKVQFRQAAAGWAGGGKRDEAKHYETDRHGYRWTVESEERAEYEHREEIRAKARRKAEFQERLREDMERDQARRSGRMFNGTHKARRDVLESDPLGYYELLGLKGRERLATPKDIQTAFRAAAQKHHPDINSEEESVAKEAMQQVLKAYGVLKDANKRKLYDSGVSTGL